MKKLCFMLMALVIVSCMSDDSIDYTGKDAINHTISVGIPELDATRAGETNMNSGLGALDNFSDDEWEKFDLRYIIEIYDVTEGYKNTTDPIKQREVQVFDRYKETSFSTRLVPNRDYRFVVWADFVEENTAADFRYNTADLNNVTRKDVAAMDESYDAYFIRKDFHISEEGLKESLVLKRPFGKIRVITTDYDEVNKGSEPTKVSVKFYDNPLYTSLNAVNGKAEGEGANEYLEYAVAKNTPYTEGYDSAEENMTLFADYIFAGNSEDMGAQEVHFEMTVWGADGREIITRKFETQIPLERNKLTTIKGNLLTTKSSVNITIEDSFDGEYEVNGNPSLAAPVVSSSVEANVVTLSWEAVENAKNYSITCGTDMPKIVDGTSYEFTGEYETEYTFAVVALPEDENEYALSQAAVVTVTTEAAPVVEQEVSATITFDNKAKRTTLTSSKQVWEENDIVVTNEKGSSTSNIADYANPARFYKGSKLTVEALGNITSIVFDCNSNSYASALKSSLPSDTTVAVSSDKVTVTLDGTSESFVINSLTGGQVRMDGITVTYKN
ncbi:MAG: hypothetical protein J6Q95_00290 [Alistipes sp.]|nr:hypothetical protein [Alistipes sp.]